MSWNLGNTSVRNPHRIKDGLRVFAENFNGDARGIQKEAQLITTLIREGVVESAQDNNEGQSWFGRKWRSCFCKLGLITSKFLLNELRVTVPGITGRPYEITPAGQLLLEADTQGAIGDVFLRQLIKLENPSLIDKSVGPVKPFILLLQLLQGLADIGERGLNKQEIAIFLQTATR